MIWLFPIAGILIGLWLFPADVQREAYRLHDIYLAREKECEELMRLLASAMQ